MPSSPAPLTLKTLGHYRIVEQIGAGGMGVVYRAYDERLQRDVALKVLPSGTLADESARKRFRQEALALSRLNHPNIAIVHDFDTQEDVDFLVTELVSGVALDSKVAGGALSENEVVQIGMQMADGIEAAHRQGVIHRDLKPANLRLTPDGRLKILDFGLAKQVDPASQESVTQSAVAPGGAAGTLAYMSPEQLRGEKVDTRSDLWGAGVVLYELATGRRPFDGNTSTMLADGILHAPVPSPQTLQSGLSSRLADIILKCLEKDAEQRYQSAKELGIDLRRKDASTAAAIAPRMLPRKRIAVWSAAATVMLVAACAGVFLVRAGRAKTLAEGDTVLLADFVNKTGDPVFDETLKQGLAFQLAQSPFIDLLPDDQVQQTLRRMNRAPDERVVGPVAREVCQRQNVKALLTGQIAALGSHYVITLDALNCATGGAIAKEQVEANSKEEVLSALGKSGTRLRRKLGESLASVQKLDKPLEEVTTSSLEALKQFGLGNEMKALGRNAEAVPYYQRAIELDPDFAIAYRLLGVVYGILREDEKARACLTRAFELRDRISERERLAISAYYYGSVTRDLEKSREAMEVHIRSYPRDPIPRGNFASLLSTYGDFEKAVESARESLNLAPNVAVSHYQLTVAYMGLNRMDDAKAVLEQQIARHVDNSNTYRSLYVIAFLQGDTAAMQRQLEWAKGKPDEANILSAQADVMMYLGRRKEGLELRRQVAERQRIGSPDAAAGSLAQAAQDEALLGECPNARRQADAVMLLPASGGKDFLPIVFARCGDTPRALALADELIQRFPQGTIFNKVTVPEVRAIVETNRGNPAKAVELLQSAEPFEKGNFAANYVRGMAYLKAGTGKEAAAEFEKVLSHRGPFPLRLQVALSNLQLARARVLAGDTAKARAAYQAFLTLWKNADPDIPVFRQAKEEYARLR